MVPTGVPFSENASPHEVQGPPAAGVLVIPSLPHSASQTPHAVPCRCVAGRLYLPLDASLHPPVSNEELLESCPWHVAFLHPTLGFSTFDHDAALNVEALLLAPPQSTSSWNLARPGPPPLPPLHAIELLHPPSPLGLFQDVAPEIGQANPSKLAPKPGEPSQNHLAHFGRSIAHAALAFFARFAQPLSNPTHSHRLSLWLQRKLAALDQRIHEARHQALHRLLHQLESDPDSGLRHAIPITPSPPVLSNTPSSNTTLPPHPTDFQLGSETSRPGESWSIPHSLQELLRLRYREMADREMRLGRHRRAAYIYAHLLGDWVSAAHALKSGRHFREAAIVFEHTLHNPREAAHCLAEGGFLTEAAQRFEDLEEWERAAELHERLGDQNAAHQALRRLVARALKEGNPSGAAHLLAHRMQLPDEALEVLFNAWPHSHQALRCVTASFQLLSQRNRHDQALARLADFCPANVPDALSSHLARVLVPVAREYPDARVRHRAADLARILISRNLPTSPGSADLTRDLMATLTQLAPEDRLLARDAHRYLLNHAHRNTPPAPALQISTPDGPRPLRRLHLPASVRWIGLRSAGPYFFAFGQRRRDAVFLRGTWSGSMQQVEWPAAFPRFQTSHLIFETSPDSGDTVLIACPDSSLPLLSLPPQDYDMPFPCHVGTPSWLPSHRFGFASWHDTTWCGHITRDRRVIVAGYSKSGDLLKTLDLTDHLRLPSPDPIQASRTLYPLTRFAAHPHGIAISRGSQLILTRADDQLEVADLPSPVRGLVASTLSNQPALILLLESGAVLRRLNSEGFHGFAYDLAPLHGCILNSGTVVLLSADEMRTYTFDHPEDTQTGASPVDASRIVGLCPASGPNECAILDADGTLTLFDAAAAS